MVVMADFMEEELPWRDGGSHGGGFHGGVRWFHGGGGGHVGGITNCQNHRTDQERLTAPLSRFHFGSGKQFLRETLCPYAEECCEKQNEYGVAPCDW